MNSTIYAPSEIISILEKMPCVWCTENEREKRYVLNAPISFDIETTSTYFRTFGKNDKVIKNKFAFMYAWAFDINDCCIMGRTWDEFIEMCDKITNFLHLDENRKILVFVHNLSFEFQFFQYFFDWAHIFATEPRKPLYALTRGGIEFRCSYRLTGYALSTIGEQLGIEKLVGELDYTKIRHFASPLSYQEKQYILHDVKIVSELIRQRIKEESGIIHIPLTKTGYVRRRFRARCLHGKYSREYCEIIARLTMTLDEYKQARFAFMGGYTHANYKHSGKVENNVESEDIGSSYPTSLIAKKFPMGKGKEYKFRSREHLRKEMYNRDYGYLLQIELENIKPKFMHEHYISYSKCHIIEKAVKNNGRIVSADRLITTITNIDFQIIDKCYTFNIVSCANVYRYPLDYLPTPFVETLLDLYADKTTLKDVDGKEKEYMSAKEDINSSFGMCVMNIVRDMVEFFGEWYVNGKPQSDYARMTDKEMEKQLSDENKKRGRFLFYLWGVWCTAWSRKRLWDGIFECGADYLYADTDSIKHKNPEKHRKFFEKANAEITKEIETALKYHGINPDRARPKTKEGKIKPLGLWEFDGHYAKFKTLGAKRYMVLYSDDKRNKPKNRGQYVLTVAGLSKKDALAYALQHKDPFAFFRNGMHVPAENTGKLTHFYIDEPRKATVTDYTGITKVIVSRSAVHLEKQDYNCSLAADYANFLKGKHDFFTK